MGRPGRPIAILARAYVIFFVCTLSLYTLLRTSLLREYVARPLAEGLASVSGLVLNLLSLNTTTSGTILRVEGFAAQIDDACTGIFVVVMYLAAVLAFPSRAGEKLTGVLLGVSTILFLNVMRIISLVYIGRNFPTLFETAHLLVWQSLIIFFALLVWLYWTVRVVSVSRY